MGRISSNSIKIYPEKADNYCQLLSISLKIFKIKFMYPISYLYIVKKI